MESQRSTSKLIESASACRMLGLPIGNRCSVGLEKLGLVPVGATSSGVLLFRSDDVKGLKQRLDDERRTAKAVVSDPVRRTPVGPIVEFQDVPEFLGISIGSSMTARCWGRKVGLTPVPVRDHAGGKIWGFFASDLKNIDPKSLEPKIRKPPLAVALEKLDSLERLVNRLAAVWGVGDPA